MPRRTAAFPCNLLPAAGGSLPAEPLATGAQPPRSQLTAGPQYGMASCSAGSRNRNSLCAGRLYTASDTPARAAGARSWASTIPRPIRGRRVAATAGKPWVRFQCQGCAP